MIILKKEKGFTLVEVLVTLAILAVLIAVSVPVYMNMTEAANEKICAVKQRDADKLYQIKRLLAGTDDNGQKAMMAAVLTEGYQAAETADGYTGVCPSGGVYAVTVKDGAAHITCSRHGTAEPDVYQPDDYIQMFLALDDIELKNVAGEVVSKGTILDYLKWKSRNETEVSLDSEANHLGDKGISKQIEAALKKAHPDVDFDTNSWRILYRKGNPEQYSITWCAENVSDKKTGDTISVTRYDVINKRYTVTETAKVAEKTAEGKKFNYIRLEEVSDWTVVDFD